MKNLLLSSCCALALALAACDSPPSSYPLATGFTHHRADSTGTNVQPSPRPPPLGFAPADHAGLEARWDTVARDLLARAAREGALPPPGAGPIALAATTGGGLRGTRDGSAPDGSRLGLYNALDDALLADLRARGHRLVGAQDPAAPALLAPKAWPYSRPRDGSDTAPPAPEGMAEFALTLTLYRPPALRGTKAGAHAPVAGAVYALPSYNTILWDNGPQ